MKKFFVFFHAIVFALILASCSSNPTSNKYEPPAPKPDTYIGTIAVAAKKADFYVRLAFDLADGYLSNESVVRKKYGKDGRYVESLEFGSAETSGEIYSSAISSPLFKYWHYDEHSVSTVTVYSELYLLSTRSLKRARVIDMAMGGSKPSYKFDLEFRNTDTTHATSEKLSFPISFTVPGHLTSRGATMNIQTPFPIYVQDSSGVAKEFYMTVRNLNGQLKVTGAEYVPKASDEFSINSGEIIITGTDESVNPHKSYTVTLAYSGDKVENKPGNFVEDSAVNGFSADFTIDKDLAYYTISGNSAKKNYVYWDYPL